MCERCEEFVICSREVDDEISCTRCGGTLLGPFAYPTPETYRERCEVLTSPHYAGAVAERPVDRK